MKSKLTVLPLVVMLWSPVFHIVESSEPASFPVSNVNFTSAPVRGLPSFHFTPGRTCRTYDVPTHLPSVASQGMYLSWSGSYRNSGSYRSPSVPVAFPPVRSGLNWVNGPHAVPDV